METYDIIMLGVLGVTTLFGFMRGIARQVASLISIPICCISAYRFHDRVEAMLSTDGPWKPYLAMLIVYCGTSFLFWFAFRFVTRTINNTQMTGFDRQMGGLLGAAKGGLLCIVVTFFAVSLTETSRAAVLRSSSGKYIATVLHEAKPIVNDKWDAQFGSLIDQLENNLDPTKQTQPLDIAKLTALAKQTPSPTAMAQQLASEHGGTTESWLSTIEKFWNANQQAATPMMPGQGGQYSTNQYPSNQYPSMPYQNTPYQAAPYQSAPYQGGAYQPQGYQPQYAPQYNAPQQYTPPSYGQQSYGQPYSQPYNQQYAPPYGQYAPQQPYYGATQPQMNPYAAGT